jgi:shikimate 5-dehydrogenase
LINNKYVDYELYDFKRASLINLKSILKKTPYLSVTSPYKNNAYKLCDEFVGPKEVLSVNCIKQDADRIIGTNTDLKGMEEILSKINASLFSKIYILGSGAMTGLLSYILDQRGLPFEMLTRRNKKIDLLSSIEGPNVLIINATSRGFEPMISSSLSGVFWDLNYDQNYANKIKENKKIKYIDGKSLLVLQAKYALSFWNLKTP